mgnify:CR=1 FL=1
MLEEITEDRQYNLTETQDDNIIKRALARIPFFDFETSKKEAMVEFQRYKRAFPNMDEYELKKRVSKKLIKDYANKSGQVGAFMCLPAVIPMLESVASFGAIPIEQMFLTRYNINLMVKLAIVNDYPLSGDNFLDTLIRSAKNHGAAGIIVKLLLRLSGVCPVIGQLFTLFIGTPLCLLINKNGTIKFGKTLLKEYDVHCDIDGFQISISNILLSILMLAAIGFAGLKVYRMFFNVIGAKLNPPVSEQQYDDNNSYPQTQAEFDSAESDL